MRSKLPRRGENSADCAKRNQASESILELKNRHKKRAKLTYEGGSPRQERINIGNGNNLASRFWS